MTPFVTSSSAQLKGCPHFQVDVEPESAGGMFRRAWNRPRSPLSPVVLKAPSITTLCSPLQVVSQILLSPALGPEQTSLQLFLKIFGKL